MYKNVVKNTVLSVSLVALLVACGGSGGSSTKSITKEYDITPIDGYIFGAKICLDLNLNSTCDIDEPSTTSKTKDYKLVISKAEHLNHKNYNIAPLLSTGGIDIDTGKEFKGILEAPKDSSKKINITPISTLVSKILSKELQTNANASEDEIEKLIKAKENLVKKVLGIKDTNLDFIAQKGTPAAKKANKVALQIQKISEALASSNNSNGTTYKKELDKVLKTFVGKIEALEYVKEGSSKLGVSVLVDSTIDVLAPEDKKTNLTTLSSNIALIFDNMKQKDDEDTSDLLDKINTLIEEEVEKIENDESIVAIKKDSKIFTKSKDEIRKLGLENKLKHLDVSDASTVATALVNITTLEISAKNLFDIIDELVLTHSQFLEIKTAIDAYNKDKDEEQKEEEQKEGTLNAIKGLAPSDGLVLFEFDKYNNNDDEYEYEKLYFNTNDKTISINEYELYVKDDSSSEWKEDTNSKSNEYILTSSGWKNETSTFPYTIDSNNIMATEQYDRKLTLISKNDISGRTVHVNDLDLDVLMPVNSLSYTGKFENKNAYEYEINSETSFTSLDTFIKAYCADNTRIPNSNSYFEKCDENQTSGNLISKSNYKIDGTWDITRVNGKDILMLKNDGNNESGSENEEYTIFSLFQKEDGSLVIWIGNAESLDKIETATFYNEAATNAIKEKIQSHINDLKTKNAKFYAFGYKWTNIKEHETKEDQYQVNRNDVSFSHGNMHIYANKDHVNSGRSRADAKVVFNNAKKEIITIVKLMDGNNGTNGDDVAKGVLQASLSNVGGVRGISFGINIKANRIDMYAWNENNDTRLIPKSDEMVLIHENININFLESTVQVKVTISVEGSILTASVIPVINGVDDNTKTASKTFDLSSYFLDTEDKTLKINQAKIKAQVGKNVRSGSARLQVMGFGTTNF